MKLRSTIICLLASVLFLFTVVPAQATPYTFNCITNNYIENALIVEARLWVDVTDPGFNQVLFTFRNDGPAASSITDAYFQDSALLGIASIDNTWDGVSFSLGASPGNLPGSAPFDFQTTAGFSADSAGRGGVAAHGVNPGEKLGIVFDIQYGLAFSDVLADLKSHALRIGIHVQAFANGGSESFINYDSSGGGGGNPIPDPATMLLLGSGNPIPEPATMLLLGSGLIGIAVSGKKRFKKRNG